MGSDSSRIISCSSAARFTSGATAGVRARFIRSNVNMPRSSGIETWRGVRGCDGECNQNFAAFRYNGIFCKLRQCFSGYIGGFEESEGSVFAEPRRNSFRV